MLKTRGFSSNNEKSKEDARGKSSNNKKSKEDTRVKSSNNKKSKEDTRVKSSNNKKSKEKKAPIDEGIVYDHAMIEQIEKEFWKKFLSYLEKNINEVKYPDQQQNTSRKDYNFSVFNLLENYKQKYPGINYPERDEKLCKLEKELESYTLSYGDENIFKSSNSLIKKLIRPNGLTAREYLKKNLSSVHNNMLNILGVYTIEALIVHVLCKLFHGCHSIHNYVRTGTLIEQLDEAVRDQAFELFIKDKKKAANPDYEVIKSYTIDDICASRWQPIPAIKSKRNKRHEKSNFLEEDEMMFQGLNKKILQQKHPGFKVQFDVGKKLLQFLMENELISLASTFDTNNKYIKVLNFGQEKAGYLCEL